MNGVLHVLVRNVGNAQLAWSTDRGLTWQWADWRFTDGFGSPTFLNFGRDYTGARDGFVYVYSADADNAYDAASQMVLARVPVNRITQQRAYQFFSGLDAEGQPTWSDDSRGRRAVFTHPGRSYRSGISYNPGLRRYLWCQVHPDSTDPRGPRFRGGLGIYDAPQPWGPWTTVFHTGDWDVGPGETCSFPPKWMSADGTVLHLVFSGDDAFSVRRARLIVRREYPATQRSGQVIEGRVTVRARLSSNGSTGKGQSIGTRTPRFPSSDDAISLRGRLTRAERAARSCTRR